MTYQMRTHSVTAQRIERVAPLIVGGDKMFAPDKGIVLRLDDGSKLTWMIDTGSPAPQVGDWLVRDADLAATVVVSAAKFAALFAAAE
jgi:hypothetical protein